MSFEFIVNKFLFGRAPSLMLRVGLLRVSLSLQQSFFHFFQKCQKAVPLRALRIPHAYTLFQNKSFQFKQINLTLFFIYSWIFPNSILKAQIGSWNIFNLKYEINQKWSLVGETQLRSLLFYNHFHYYEYKGFINKKWHKDFITSLGIGSYQTYQEGGNFVTPKNNDEIRITPQIITLQNFNPIQLEHRYRWEGRFTNNGYKNRIRYRIGTKFSFPKIPLSIFFNNEIFFGTNPPYFERNRASFIAQLKISKLFNYQIGFLNQLDYKINDETGRNFLIMGILLDIKRQINTTDEILD